MRKTNLFYLTENKSNFLTFSNYGEYLTGVCLSTNHKIFPSSFICLDLPFNANKTLDDFKKFLMCYYENKLAWLRDDNDANDNKQEDLNIHGELLNYLLESICIFFGNDDVADIKYYGDIVEHDYNGTYNDSICIVDFNRFKQFTMINNHIGNYSYSYNADDLLHNWTAEELDEPLHYQPIYDNTNNDNVKYNYENFIKFNNDGTSELLKPYEISFNCIISLFDVINVSIEENTDIINESFEDDDRYKRIPYGIWFASEKENNTLNNIELHKENDNISQSWSLVISSKFAPFPFGIKINDNTINDIEKYTYAELLAKNSELLNLYTNLLQQITKLSSDINILNNKILNIEALYPNNSYSILDNVNALLTQSEAYVNEKVNNLEKKFDDYMNQYKWKSINTSNDNN